jgi:hypothetical protein
MKKSAKILLLSFLLLFSNQLISSNSLQDNQIEAGKYINAQKIFVHTDKSTYFANETIWFNIYILNSTSLSPDTLSSNVYMDVIDHEGKIVYSRILRISDGMAHGDIFLTDTISEGNYMIAAYTDWSRAISDRNVFTKSIFVYNPHEADYISRKKRKSNKNFNKYLAEKKENIIVEFYPESGSFIKDIENLIVVNVEDGIGSPIDFKGEIFTNDNVRIDSISSLMKGYGYFVITPKPGNTYFAKISREDEDDKIIPINLAAQDGGILKILDSDDGNIYLSVITADNYSDKNFSLSVHNNIDKVLSININANNIYSISKSILPSGVLLFNINDSSGNIIAERLFFIFKDDILKFSIKDIEHSPIKEELHIPISFSSNNEMPVSGMFSLSVEYLSDCDKIEERESNIVENLLLNSDIIEELSGFQDIDFSDVNSQMIINIYLIAKSWMWNYNKQSFLMENLEMNKLFPEKLTLTGRVMSEDKKKYISNDFYISITDQNRNTRRTMVKGGLFEFDNINYDGAFKIALQAESVNRHFRSAFIEVFLNDFESISYKFTPQTKPHLITEKGENWKRKNPWYTRFFKSPLDPSDSGTRSNLNPDQVIYLDDISNRHHQNMRSILTSNITGLGMDQSGRLILRGSSSVYLSSEPSYFVDGLIVSSYSFLNMNVNEIDRIEVFKGPSASIFGIRGSNGVIYAHTKRASFRDEYVLEFELMGYHVPVKFDKSDAFEKNGLPLPCATVFYKPDIILKNQNDFIVEIPFKLPKGKYAITVQGISKDGKPGYARVLISID